MLTLLLIVLILGIIAWAIQSIDMPTPFKTIAYAILIIILLVLLFRLIGVNLPLSIR